MYAKTKELGAPALKQVAAILFLAIVYSHVDRGELQGMAKTCYICIGGSRGRAGCTSPMGDSFSSRCHIPLSKIYYGK